MKTNMVYGFGGGSGKAVSEASGGVYKPRRVVSGSAFKNLWRTLRNGLDAVAQGAGVPLATLRQQYRNDGVNPDRFNEQLERIIQQQDLDVPGMDDQELNELFAQAESTSRAPKANAVLIGGLIILVLLIGGRR